VIVIWRGLRRTLAAGDDDVRHGRHSSWHIVANVLTQQQNPYLVTHFLRWPSLWMMITYVCKSLQVPVLGYRCDTD